MDRRGAPFRIVDIVRTAAHGGGIVLEVANAEIASAAEEGAGARGACDRGRCTGPSGPFSGTLRQMAQRPFCLSHHRGVLRHRQSVLSHSRPCRDGVRVRDPVGTLISFSPSAEIRVLRVALLCAHNLAARPARSTHHSSVPPRLANQVPDVNAGTRRRDVRAPRGMRAAGPDLDLCLQAPALPGILAAAAIAMAGKEPRDIRVGMNRTGARPRIHRKRSGAPPRLPDSDRGIASRSPSAGRWRRYRAGV